MIYAKSLGSVLSIAQHSLKNYDSFTWSIMVENNIRKGTIDHRVLCKILCQCSTQKRQLSLSSWASSSVPHIYVEYRPVYEPNASFDSKEVRTKGARRSLGSL